RATRRYDERGNEVETAFFGPDRKPIVNSDGYHRFTARHDEEGNRVEAAFFGIDGKPRRRRTVSRGSPGATTRRAGSPRRRAGSWARTASTSAPRRARTVRGTSSRCAT